MAGQSESRQPMHSDARDIRAFPLLAMAFAALIGLLPANGSLSEAGELRPRGEYEIKAALVFNFLKFVEWPSKPVGGDLRLCVLGHISRARSLVELDNQAVAGRRLTVVQAAPHDLAGCDVLFLLKSEEEQRFSGILAAIKGGNILTIGETEGSASKGVIINFFIVQKKVRFEINADAARDAGIIISAKLMKLAARVYDSKAGGD